MCITYLKVARRLDLKYYHYVKEMLICDRVEVLSDAMMVIILQYINLLNQHVLHLKHMMMLYVNYISMKWEGEMHLSS